MIPIRRALRVGDAPQVAFVGAGGKSAALFALARQFEKAFVTTTTHLSSVQASSGDLHVPLSSVEDVRSLDAAKLPRVTTFTGSDQADGRVNGPAPEVLKELSDFARHHSLPLLIEADGARLRALKAPAEHEPVIPDLVDAVVVLAGLSAVGKPLGDEWVHRPERYAELSKTPLGEEIITESLGSVLLNPDGGLKNIPKHARRIAYLNQADTPQLEAVAREISPQLLNGYDAVWVGAMQTSTDLSAVYEPVAGILLAAGESKRLGQPKALLDWKRKPFVRQVGETALAAGLRPLVVVTGADAEMVEPALNGLDVQILRNTNWQDGQSSSVKAGLRALPTNIGSALFLVVDQPQLPVPLIEALVAEHSTSLAPIVAPMVDDHRSNPVLFDRSTFSDFSLLEGDVGGRAIFSRHRVNWVPWLDASLAIDVDTQSDYQQLLKKAG